MKPQPKLLDVLTPDEEATLLEALKREDRRYHIAALLMLTTGLRVGEVCSLTWDDVMQKDQARDYIELRPEQTKGERPRTVPIPTTTQEAIAEFRKRAYYWRADLDGSQPMIKSSRSNDALHPRDLQRRILTIGQRTIHRRVTPHLLRHTYATRMAQALKVEDLAKLLGHSDTRTTMIYYHPSKTELRAAANQARSLKTRRKRTTQKRQPRRPERRPQRTRPTKTKSRTTTKGRRK